MRAVRLILCWMYACEAVVCLWNVPSTVIHAVRLYRGHGSLLAWWHLASILPMAVAGMAFAMLCVTFLAKRRTARAWAIMSGTLNVVFAGFLMALMSFAARLGHGSAIHLGGGIVRADVLTLALGFTGITAFWRWDGAAEQKVPGPPPSRLAAEGAHSALDKLVWVSSLAAAVAAMFGWWHWARLHGLPHAGGLPLYVEALEAEFAMVAVHELGHVLVGKALGMRLRGLAVGPFQARVRDGRWTFRFRLSGLFATGGATAVVPTNPRQPLSRRIWMIAGGPLASGVTGLLALGLVLMAPRHSWGANWQPLALFATFSLIAAVANLIPFRTQASWSDGAQIAQLRSGGPWADFHQALSVVGSSTVTRLRPRDFDILALERAARGITGGIPAVQLRLLAYLYYLDSSQLREATQALNEAEAVVQESAPDLPVEFYADFVFGKAFVQRDAEGARLWWERMEARKPARSSADYWLARTAVLWIDGRTQEAKEAWEKGNAQAQRLPKAGAYEAERDRFALLRRELDAERRIPRWHDDLAFSTH